MYDYFSIDNIKSQVNIVDLVSRDENLTHESDYESYGAHVKKHSSDKKRCLFVNEEKQVFHCFHCGAKGDIFNYAMDRDNCGFIEAVEWICDTYSIPFRKLSPEEKAEYERKKKEEKTVRKLIKEAFKFYHDSMTDAQRAYYHDRGLTDKTIDNEWLGYAPNGNVLTNYFRKKYGNEILPTLAKTGLVFKNDNGSFRDRYQDRYVIPYWYQNQIVFSIGRSLDPEIESWKKYVKHLTHKPDYPYVSDVAVKHIIWGEDLIRGKEKVIICEGIIGALLTKQIDYNVISPVTVQFSDRDNERLAEFCKNAKTVYLINDNEEPTEEEKEKGETLGAGLRGAKKTARILTREGIKAKIVVLPRPEGEDKIDLADFIVEHGDKAKEELDKLLESALDPFNFELQQIDPNIDKMDLVEKLREIIENAVRVGKEVWWLRLWLENKVAKRFELKSKEVEDFRKMISEIVKDFQDAQKEAEAKETIEEVKQQAEMTEEEKQTAIDYLEDPKLFENIERDLTEAGIIKEDTNKLMIYVTYTTRKFKKPISITVFGQSSSGKSYLVNTVADFFPLEDKLILSSASAKSLEYLTEDQLKHKILIVQELEGAEEVMTTIRTLQSEGRLNRLVTITDTESGIPEAVQTSKVCPCSVIITTTQDLIHEENSTRIFELYVNEDIEQTEGIVRANFERSGIDYILEENRRQVVKKLHWNIQRLLKPIQIDIPYRNLISFPAYRTRHRRDSQRFIELIRGVAFLHQYQKEIKKTENGIEYIEADLRDYDIAYTLANDVLRATLDELSTRAWKVLEVSCHVHYEKVSRLNPDTDEKFDGFTRKDIQKKSKELKIDIGTYRNFSKQLETLVDAEYLEVLEGGQGKSYKYDMLFKYEVSKKGKIIVKKPSIENLTTPEELRKKIKETD